MSSFLAVPTEVLDQLVDPANSKWMEGEKTGERILSHSLTFLFNVSIFISKETLLPFKSGLKITANFLQVNCSLKYIIYHFLPHSPSFVMLAMRWLRTCKYSCF